MNFGDACSNKQLVSVATYIAHSSLLREAQRWRVSDITSHE